MKAILWMIDPGHGAAGDQGDPGAVDPVELDEQDTTYTQEDKLAYIMAHKIGQRFEAAGQAVQYTRGPDEYVSLRKRAALANQALAGAFISIHYNAAANPQASGFEVFSAVGSVRGRALRDHVLTAMAARFPDRKNRGGKEARFVVLMHTAMPAILVEMGFITNPQEERLMLDETVQNLQAEAVVHGALAWLHDDIEHMHSAPCSTGT